MSIVKHMESTSICAWVNGDTYTKLQAICDTEHLTKAEILKKLIHLFLSDIDFQRKIVGEVKKL